MSITRRHLLVGGAGLAAGAAVSISSMLPKYHFDRRPKRSRVAILNVDEYSPKVEELLESALRLFSIDVAGKARITMIDNGLTTDHNVLHTMNVQEPDELKGVRREMRSFYRLIRLVWHSRTSGLFPGKRRFLSSRAARIRSAGLMA